MPEPIVGSRTAQRYLEVPAMANDGFRLTSRTGGQSIGLASSRCLAPHQLATCAVRSSATFIASQRSASAIDQPFRFA